MSLDGRSLASRLSLKTGMIFTEGKSQNAHGRNFGQDEQYVEIVPNGYSPAHSFSLLGRVGWRHVETLFRPGIFAGNLVQEMGRANLAHRRAFVAVVQQSIELGATLRLTVNDIPVSYENEDIWESEWTNFELSMRKGGLTQNDLKSQNLENTVLFWMVQMMSSILALMIVEDIEAGSENPALAGYPEGALSIIKVNSYERNPRNRAAALAIHGSVCAVCRKDLSDEFGDVAAGTIEIHHITPVSELGKDYVLDPKNDLVPLCPNCHAVAHKRNPPYSIDELQALREKASTK